MAEERAAAGLGTAAGLETAGADEAMAGADEAMAGAGLETAGADEAMAGADEAEVVVERDCNDSESLRMDCSEQRKLATTRRHASAIHTAQRAKPATPQAEVGVGPGKHAFARHASKDRLSEDSLRQPAASQPQLTSLGGGKGVEMSGRWMNHLELTVGLPVEVAS